MKQRTVFTVEDQYGVLDEEYMVFDSEDTEQFGGVVMTIETVLKSLKIHDIAQVDRFVSLKVEV